MKPRIFLATCAAVAAFAGTLQSSEWHVATRGQDSNPGTAQAPLRSIQRAADLAQPGDTITVHEGIYRERVNPPRGGASEQQRIVYRAAPGERVEIKGSEIVKGWVKVQGDVWKVSLTNAFFRGFNPYSDLIHGDWFDGKKRLHHTGAVYLNGAWLTEAARLEDVILPPGQSRETQGSISPLWFGQVDATNTTLWAQFEGVNPNEQFVEVNARRTVFYPDQPGRNYITVRGFILSQTTTP